MANRSHRKKKSRNKMRFLGFDFSDRSYLITFVVFAFISVAILALLIYAIVSAATSCAGKAEGSEAPAIIVSAADVSDSDVSASDLVTFNNGVFTFDYDGTKVGLTDRFAEGGYVTVARDEEIPVALTVSYKNGMTGADPAEYLKNFIASMAGAGTMTEVQTTPAAEENGVNTATCSFKMDTGSSIVTITTKMLIHGDDGIVSQLYVQDGVEDSRIDSLEAAYKTVRFC